MDKRTEIIKVLNKTIDLCEELCKFNKILVNDKTKNPTFNKFLKNCDKARKYLLQIKHEDLLVSIYNNIFKGKESVFSIAPSLINHKQIKYFDTVKGHKEFVELEKQALEEEKVKFEEAQKQREEISKAKAEGKEIQFVYKNGKMQPVIVNNNDK